MDPTMDSTKHILNYLMPILEQVDAELHDFMIRYTRTRTLTCWINFQSEYWPLEVIKSLIFTWLYDISSF